MCFKRNEPVRLAKNKENKSIKIIKELIINPYFWGLVILILVLSFLVWFAMQESVSYFVYNRGGL